MDAQARRRRFGLIAIGVACIAALSIAGCETYQRTQGESQIVAGFRGRTLHAELPDAVRVPGAHYASVAALRTRGYAIEEDEVSRDSGRVVGRQARSAARDALDRVVIRTRLTPSRVGVSITTQPLPDEVLARSILDDVLVRLGM
ncbi:MAG: hypothetical protein AAFX79_12125 [Planctomycetota bacterium]